MYWKRNLTVDDELHSYMDESWVGIKWGKYRNTGGAVSPKENVTFMEIPVFKILKRSRKKSENNSIRVGARVVQFNPIMSHTWVRGEGQVFSGRI
jgi:hypothetical protein